MSLVAAGPDSVVWTASPTAGSPFPGGVVSIVLAWFITPLMAALIAGLFFLFIKVVVLKAKNPFRMSLFFFPLNSFICAWVITYFTIQKGVNGWLKPRKYTDGCPPSTSGPPPAEGSDVYTGCTVSNGTNAWISTVIAFGIAVIAAACIKLVVRLVERDLLAVEAQVEAELGADRAAIEGEAEAGGQAAGDAAEVAGADAAEGAAGEGVKKNPTPKLLQDMRKSKVWSALTAGVRADIHASSRREGKIRDVSSAASSSCQSNQKTANRPITHLHPPKRTLQMHAAAEVFDGKTELSFRYLQVLSACANSFAHGANDVANAIGPLAAIYSIWECTCVESKSEVPVWMFVIGGAGLIVGIATLGYKIMGALGVKMTKLTNSRGYCAELTAAIVVIVSSRYGFPVSTTQVITGAIAGIGVQEVLAARMRGEKDASIRFNFRLLGKFFLGWMATLAIAGLTAAAFTAQGIYAPNIYVADAITAAAVAAAPAPPPYQTLITQG
jgi:sodium-dependent phosphate transporter